MLQYRAPISKPIAKVCNKAIGIEEDWDSVKEDDDAEVVREEDAKTSFKPTVRGTR